MDVHLYVSGALALKALVLILLGLARAKRKN